MNAITMQDRAVMPKAPTERVNITLRVTEELRARLEQAAASGDRSLNSEITSRLEHSFDERETLADLFGDDQIAAFLLQVASILRMGGEHLRSGPWRSDMEASTSVRMAVEAVLAGFTAPGSALPAPGKRFLTSGTKDPETAALAAQLAERLKLPR